MSEEKTNVESGEKRGKKRGSAPGIKYKTTKVSMNDWYHATPLYMHFPPKSSTVCIKLMVSIKIARVGGDALLSLSRTDCKLWRS
jgi:hypothetical protein